MLKDKLMSKLNKKGAKDLDPMEKEAKMNIVKELGRQAGSMLSDKIHPMKKVMVAADSKQGLKEGLNKAAGIVDHADEMEHDPEKLVEEAEEESGADLDHDGEEGESDQHLGNLMGNMTHNEPAEGSMGQLADEDEAMAPHEIDAKIAKLEALRAKKSPRMS